MSSGRLVIDGLLERSWSSLSCIQDTEGARGNNRNSQVKGQKASQVF